MYPSDNTYCKINYRLIGMINWNYWTWEEIKKTIFNSV